MDKQFSVNGVHCRITQWGRIKTMPGKNYLPNYIDKKTGHVKVKISGEEFDVAELVLKSHGRKPKSREIRSFKDGDPLNIHIRNLEWVEEKPVKKAALNDLSLEHRKFIYDLKQKDMKPKEICEEVLKEFFLDINVQMVNPAAKGYKTHLINTKSAKTKQSKKQETSKEEPKKEGDQNPKDPADDLVDRRQEGQSSEESKEGFADQNKESDNAGENSDALSEGENPFV